MKPQNSGETFWMFLSLLCLPVDRQLEVIGGVPLEGQSIVSKHGTNADHILWVLQVYYTGWFDEFDESQSAREIITLIEANKFSTINYLNDFVGSEHWIKLRGLAKAALNESGLDCWPINETINFYEYIELQD